MQINDLIVKKRDGGILTKEEIEFIVNGYTGGSIPDYQMSAFLMAVYFKGLNADETRDLTLSMAASGDVMDLSKIAGVKIDKHSTGGIGDKTTLIVGPIVASLGVPVAKMSGRGLGFTGGTIDKLESIPGFKTSISEETFISNVNEIGFALAGQTKNLAPADKKIYALRDVTGTVENMSLIASSIMSKKIASGADAICLDVKYGSGAFMKTKQDAEKLGEAMCEIGRLAGRRVIAFITNMEEPLGRMAGNSLEVIEAIETLKGNGEERLTELCLSLSAGMLFLAGKLGDSAELTEEILDKGRRMAAAAIESGAALAKLEEFIRAQDGDAGVISDYNTFAKAKVVKKVEALEDGYISCKSASKVGAAVLALGGGRHELGDAILPEVGVEVVKKSGDKIAKGETFAVLYADSDDAAQTAEMRIREAYEISSNKPTIEPIIYKYIG